MSKGLEQNLAGLIAGGSPASLPAPDTDTPMVSRSLRVPIDLDQRVRDLAEARGVGVTTLMRQFIEAGVAELDDSAVVPLADVRRVLAALARQHRAA
jgi:predicted DNA-binding protein